MSKKNKEPEVLWQYKIVKFLALALVFVIPLYFNTDHWFPFNSSKIILSIGIILFILLFFTWGKLSENNFSISFNPLHIVVKLFLVILTVSAIFGIDPHNSFFGSWNQSTSLVLLYILTIYACIVGFLIKKDNKFIIKILLASFLSAVCVAFISHTGNSVFPFFGDNSSTIGNSSYAGAYLLFNAGFGAGLFFYYKKLWKKIFIFISNLIIIFCPLFFNKNIFLGKISLMEIFHDPFLLLGVANGAAIGLLISFIVIFIFYLILSSVKIKRIAGLVLLFALLCGVSYAGVMIMNPDSKVNQVYVEEKGQNRLLAWDSAISGFLDRPVLGFGFNNFYYNYQKYFSSKIFEGNNIEFFFAQPHNVVLEHASNSGILGLGAYIALFIYLIIILCANRKDEKDRYKFIKISLIGVLFGYFIQNLFVFDTITTYLMFFTIIGIGLGLNKKEWNFNIPIRLTFLYKIILFIILVISIISMFMFVYRPWQESIGWNRLSTTRNLRELIPLRQGLQETSIFGGVEDSGYSASELLVFYNKNLDKVNDSTRQYFIEEIDSVIAQVEKDSIKQPYNIRAPLVIGKLLNLRMFINGSTDSASWLKAKENLEKALVLNEKNPKIYLSLSQLYVFIKDSAKAKFYKDKALEITSN